MGKRLKKKRYIKGLDGIRAIAVVAVILYHLAPFSFQGGFLGVPIFFVVSGYLITDLLFQEFQQNGTIDVKAFYIRRIKRLYPGLVAMVLSTAAYITMFSRGLAENLKSVIGTNFYMFITGIRSIIMNRILTSSAISRRLRICGHCRLKDNFTCCGQFSFLS